MRYLSTLMLIAALLPAMAAPAPAATVRGAVGADRLTIGSVELRLGMAEKPALTALEHEFHVEPARGSGEDWAILKNGETVAVVTFHDG
jgi:hypothetical protein